MKNIIKIIGVALLMIAFTQNSTAQVKFSAGIETGIALESVSDAGFMYGLSIGGEYAMGNKTSFTLQTGYILVSVNKPSHIDKFSFSLLPIHAGYKYYFDSNEGGIYLHGQIGVHIAFSSIEFTETTFDFESCYFSSNNIRKQSI